LKVVYQIYHSKQEKQKRKSKFFYRDNYTYIHACDRYAAYIYTYIYIAYIFLYRQVLSNR
jgi:hypothetical protein